MLASLSQREQKIIALCAANITDSKWRKLLDLITHDGGLSTRAIAYCVANGLRSLVIDEKELAEQAKRIAEPSCVQIMPAHSILALAKPKLEACFHVQHLNLSGTWVVYPVLYLGSHSQNNQCNPLGEAKAKEAICSNLIKSNSFGIQLNSYPVRELHRMSDGSIRAICYGADRWFTILASQALPNRKD